MYFSSLQCQHLLGGARSLEARIRALNPYSRNGSLGRPSADPRPRLDHTHPQELEHLREALAVPRAHLEPHRLRHARSRRPNAQTPTTRGHTRLLHPEPPRTRPPRLPQGHRAPGQMARTRESSARQGGYPTRCLSLGQPGYVRCNWRRRSVSYINSDVIRGSKRNTGFDYQFNAIQNESNELFNAYKDMFEVAITQGTALSTAIIVYAPWIHKIFVSQHRLPP